jgi:hypothetical protein
MKKIILLLLLISNAAFADVTYILPTKMGETIFNDIMVVNEIPMFGKFEGTIEVPGMFKAQIENAIAEFRWAGISLKFEITANENGKVYKVLYRLFHPHDDRNITGTLSLEDGTVIGKITGGHLVLDKDK